MNSVLLGVEVETPNAGPQLVTHMGIGETGAIFPGSVNASAATTEIHCGVSAVPGGLYRIEVYNPGPYYEDLLNHSPLEFNHVAVLLPPSWGVQFDAELDAVNFGPLPWTAGLNYWSLVDTLDTTFERHGFPQVGNGKHRLEGRQKATWVIGEQTDLAAEAPNPIHATTADSVRKFLKTTATVHPSTGFARLDTFKADVMKSNGRSVDSALSQPTGIPNTLGWWLYNSHQAISMPGPGSSQSPPHGFRTWMHFGNTPSQGQGAQGGTNGRYETALWLLENYLANPADNIASYQLALQMVRQQVSHGYVWGDGVTQTTPKAILYRTRRYESSSKDFAGDSSQSKASHSWATDWWMVGALSGDPLILSAATELTDFIVEVVNGGGCKEFGEWYREDHNSRILGLALRNLYAGYLVTGNVAYRDAAQKLIDESYEKILRIIPLQGNELYIPRAQPSTAANPVCSPWQDLRVFAAQLDWLDEGVGLNHQTTVYEMIRYSADRIADYFPSAAAPAIGRIPFELTCGAVNNACQPISFHAIRDSNGCVDSSLAPWDTVTISPLTAHRDFGMSDSTINTAYAVYPYYRLAKDGAAVLGLTPAEVSNIRAKTRAMAQSAYGWFGAREWSRQVCMQIALEDGTPLGACTNRYPIAPEFVSWQGPPVWSAAIPGKDWGRYMYGARPIVLHEIWSTF